MFTSIVYLLLGAGQVEDTSVRQSCWFFFCCFFLLKTPACCDWKLR